MDDLRANLITLAERGTPLGPDEMIERVEAVLGGDTVAVRSRATVRLRPGSKRLLALAATLGLAMISLLSWAIADSETYFDAAAGPAGSAEALFLQRVATIEGMVDAYNAGEFEVFRSYFTEVPTLFSGPALDDSDWEAQRSLMAAGEVWEITGSCEPRGRAVVGCPVTMENEFLAPAGIRLEMPALLVGFDEDGAIRSIGMNTWEAAGLPRDYSTAFDDWLEAAHPDIHASFGPRIGGENSTWADMPASADMSIALEYVEEFLEHSEEYPLTD